MNHFSETTGRIGSALTATESLKDVEIRPVLSVEQLYECEHTLHLDAQNTRRALIEELNAMDARRSDAEQRLRATEELISRLERVGNIAAKSQEVRRG